MSRVPVRKAHECCRHAAECNEKAKLAHDPDARMFWKEREEFWMNLAQSYEYSAQMSPAAEAQQQRVH
jgi:hypothetical protein